MQSVLLKIRTGIVPVAAGLWLAMTPSSARGQSIINPTAVEFDASTDHDVTAPDGAALVTRYELQFYLVGAAAPFQTGSLGKPAAASGGRIRVTLLSIFGALPSPGIVYEARVAAVGPGSTATSEVSNSFMFAASCTYSVAPASQWIPPAGGSGNESVTSGSGCPWTAVSNASWLTITTGQYGSGPGTVAFSVAANTGAQRSGTLIVGGQTVTVSQGESESAPGRPSGFRVLRP